MGPAKRYFFYWIIRVHFDRAICYLGLRNIARPSVRFKILFMYEKMFYQISFCRRIRLNEICLMRVYKSEIWQYGLMDIEIITFDFLILKLQRNVKKKLIIDYLDSVIGKFNSQ